MERGRIGVSERAWAPPRAHARASAGHHASWCGATPLRRSAEAPGFGLGPCARDPRGVAASDVRHGQAPRHERDPRGYEGAYLSPGAIARIRTRPAGWGHGARHVRSWRCVLILPGASLQPGPVQAYDAHGMERTERPVMKRPRQAASSDALGGHGGGSAGRSALGGQGGHVGHDAGHDRDPRRGNTVADQVPGLVSDRIVVRDTSTVANTADVSDKRRCATCANKYSVQGRAGDDTSV